MFLDGFICDRDVELIEWLSAQNTLTFTFLNEYRPYVGHKIEIYPYWHTDNSAVINSILDAIKQNKRIMVSVTSSNLAHEIYDAVQSANQCSIKLYTGEDLLMVEPGVLMRQLKKHDFSDVTESWKDAQIVIHTQSLQSGVDFSVEVEHTFDTFVHVYGGMSSTADQFIQSTLWCRNWKGSVHKMFIRKGAEQSYVVSPNDAFKHINKLYSRQ